MAALSSLFPSYTPQLSNKLWFNCESSATISSDAELQKEEEQYNANLKEQVDIKLTTVGQTKEETEQTGEDEELEEDEESNDEMEDDTDEFDTASPELDSMEDDGSITLPDDKELMAFACQRNSYLKELVSKVISCVKIKDGFEVILNDSVLFPEGGGQPTDQGWIGETPVTSVLRRGKDAVHITTDEVKEGSEFLCKINWERRFDHMQQHSGSLTRGRGQFIEKYVFLYGESKEDGIIKNIVYICRDLGKTISHVELNTPKITDKQLQEIEATCNEHIRQHRPLIVHYLTKEEALELKEVKTRGLPDDAVEPIRVIEIEGVEKNMCCGTHVANLSDIQVIKLLHTESMRGGTRLFFLAGDRVMQKLNSLYIVERSLTKSLSCGSEEHVGNVEKLKSNLRISQKANRGYLKEIAQYEAGEISRDVENKKYIFKHREDGDMDYLNTLLRSFTDKCKDYITFVCGGPVKTGGQFILRGPEEKVNDLSPKICQLIDGKGGGKKGQFQGKAASFKKLKEVEEVLKQNL